MKRAGFQTQDEGGYLASVSDLMSGLIFIFIIMLVAFALGLQAQQDRLDRAKEERSALLEEIEQDLLKQGIAVKIEKRQGVLRLGESLLFAQGKADLSDGARQNVGKLAEVLLQVLPCYAEAPADLQKRDCGERGRSGKVDAIFIEGHTDNVPLNGYGQYRDNWDLSVGRAKAIFTELLVASQNRLDRLLNRDGQPVLGLSGYEARRPVAGNDTDANRALNRRIDLRFVMVPPDDEALPLPAAETQRGLQQ